MAKKKEETVKVHIPIDQLNPKDLEIIVGNLKKIVFKNKFDYIVLIGKNI